MDPQQTAETMLHISKKVGQLQGAMTHQALLLSQLVDLLEAYADSQLRMLKELRKGMEDDDTSKR